MNKYRFLCSPYSDVEGWEMYIYDCDKFPTTFISERACLTAAILDTMSTYTPDELQLFTIDVLEEICLTNDIYVCFEYE